MEKRLLFISAACAIFRVLTYCAVMILILIWSPRAQAHPHVFIVQRLELLFDDKGLAGIKVQWKFDDMFAAMIAKDHDRDRNGILEAQEVASIKEKAFSYISEYGYFSFIKIENKPFPVKFIQNFNAFLENKGLVYEFLIPCHIAATNQFKKVSLATYDPTYYCTIDFAEKEPVSLTSGEGFEIKTVVREDPKTKIYYGMIHPWTLFLEFRKKL